MWSRSRILRSLSSTSNLPTSTFTTTSTSTSSLLPCVCTRSFSTGLSRDRRPKSSGIHSSPHVPMTRAKRKLEHREAIRRKREEQIRIQKEAIERSANERLSRPMMERIQQQREEGIVPNPSEEVDPFTSLSTSTSTSTFKNTSRLAGGEIDRQASAIIQSLDPKSAAVVAFSDSATLDALTPGGISSADLQISPRRIRVGRTVQQIVCQVLYNVSSRPSGPNFRSEGLLIRSVEMSTDMGYATISWALRRNDVTGNMEEEIKKEKERDYKKRIIGKALAKLIPQIRYQLGIDLNIRYVPEIRFRFDTQSTLETSRHDIIEELVRQQQMELQGGIEQEQGDEEKDEEKDEESDENDIESTSPIRSMEVPIDPNAPPHLQRTVAHNLADLVRGVPWEKLPLSVRMTRDPSLIPLMVARANEVESVFQPKKPVHDESEPSHTSRLAELQAIYQHQQDVLREQDLKQKRRKNRR